MAERLTSLPSTAEMRAVCQPPSTMNRRNGEHWAGVVYGRKVSIHLTKVFLRTGWSADAVTWLMIVVGTGAGLFLLIPGVWGAVLTALAVQLYLVLDCCDGEVARWRGQTSAAGVFLDRVGHYLCEACICVALGFRAADLTATGYAVLGCLAALAVVIVKAETDLVLAARYSAGLTEKTTDDDLAPINPLLGKARAAGQLLKVHRITGAVEASILIVIVAIIDAARDDLTATRVLVVAFLAVAAAQVVLHLVSILASRRLR
jgi:phosphatidylglycerophosphate synthase